MVLSVIIVNYRVRYFLELCLHSVRRALAGIGPAEIIVVDNASGDGSVEALRLAFPGVRFVENRENVGFARANNQALRLAGGEYVLFLNPDTVLPEDFARLCLDFMRSGPPIGGSGAGQGDQHVSSSRPGGRGIGAVGVRMIDGSGAFLPESRRGFPSPWVAFCKLAGLTALFPRNRFFARYYLGGVPADKPHPAPVLSGACMMARRSILGEVGGFDERFFMYAEDIDLSYRIEKAGYVNFYFPGTTIVHFKGESTQKDIRYIRMFYKAMSQFRRKHFNRGLPAIWNWGMEAAIWIRVGLGGLGRAHVPQHNHAHGSGQDNDPSHGPYNGPGQEPNPNHAPAPASAAGRQGDPSSASSKRSLWITGDAAETARVKEELAGKQDWEIASEEKAASVVLLCEGEDFSFRECIHALEHGGFARQHPRGQKVPKVLIHASGSRSAAGSTDREGRGEIVVF